MQQYYCDTSKLSYPKKFFYVALATMTSESITYPLDRLKTILQARTFSISKSFLDIKEIKYVYYQIISIEKYPGLIYGIKTGIDRSFSIYLSRFFLYDFILRNKDRKNCSNSKILLTTIQATTFSTLISQLSNILKIKIQTEKLGSSLKNLNPISHKYQEILELHSKDHSFLFKCGAVSNIISSNLMALFEISSFLTMYHLIKKKFDYLKESQKMIISSIFSSIIAVSFVHPIEFIHIRLVLSQIEDNKQKDLRIFLENIIKNEGLTAFYKGYLVNLMRVTSFNCILMGILNQFLVFEEKKKMKWEPPN